MPIWEYYRDLRIEQGGETAIKRRYSVTAHVLSFKRCSLQYGYIAERKYEPALVVQMYYGTMIHQVLDRAHRHYAGLYGPRIVNSMPTDDDIKKYFLEVENSLKAQKIYPVNKVRKAALETLQRFNRIEGPELYPRVIDTEFKLQADQGEYILHGVVDVLAQTGETSQASTDEFGNYEIWDYKGTDRPSRSESCYDDYIFQMLVYAELYRQKTGLLPMRGVIYFLNELSGEDPARPVNATIEIPFDTAQIDEAMEEFDKTVGEIKRCKDAGVWPEPEQAPPEDTCKACDFRWNCPAAKRFGREFEMRYP